MRSRAALLGVLLAVAQPARAEPDDYRLGPSDHLTVKVYDLRTGTGEAYQWSAFTGEFIVGASGRVALPLVGELDAGGKTTSELAAAIATHLQAKVGLALKPDASVQVAKFRPFYVTGAVEKPGEYDYRPGLTVLQAVSIAGGQARLPTESLLGYVREAVSVRGDLRVLMALRLSLMARQARLDAEIREADTIALPAEVRAKIDDPEVSRIVREEQLLFEARRTAIQSQTASLEQTKTLQQREVESLRSKEASTSHQLDITRKELEQITGLVAKGLTVLPRQLEIERSSAQFESNRLDVQSAILRAQTDISKADRDILELHNTRRASSLQEASEIRNKLDETNEKIRTTQALIENVDQRAPPALSGAVATLDVTYFVTRNAAGSITTQAAHEDDPVWPGDVVRIVPRSGSPDGGTAGRTALNPVSRF